MNARCLSLTAAGLLTMACSGPLFAQSVGGAPGNERPTAATPGVSLNSSASGPATDDFIKSAEQAGSAEVVAAQFAVAHSQSPDVKAFAQRMISDHGAANAQLKDIAVRKGITVPTDVNSGQTRMMTQLQTQSGAAFDAAYAHAMAHDHTEAVALFKQAAANMKIDNDVRAFAQKTLPTLQDHLTAANKLVSDHGGGTSSTSAH
jgi:putative membrane protein